MNLLDVAWDLAYAANQEWDLATQLSGTAEEEDHQRKHELFMKMAGVVINRDSNDEFTKSIEAITMGEETTTDDYKNTMNNARAELLLNHIKDERIVGNLIKRHQIKQFLRSIFDSLDFIEIDTPILGSAMTEYTKDNFVVNGNAGQFYLPQSPQVYKQALVINTFPKYFQFAKCFRDEDYGDGKRTDQLHEFTQVDLELRCENDLELRSFAEKIMSQLFSKFGKECITPFPIMDYRECIAKYGTDKPDLRDDSTENAFLWVVNFPQFVKNDLGDTVITHHPFQMPIIEDISDISKKTFEIGSNTFDLVLNGVEIGGGDMRIHDYEIQKEVLKVLGLKPSQFALLLESLKGGQAPKHGGMAIGLDRITMALTDTEKIRDVTAFNL